MMPLERRPSPEAIAQALGSAKRTGGGWSCKCPAHDDKHASLSVTEKDGKLLWKCHAGCEQGAVHAALAERGLIRKPSSPLTPRITPRPPMKIIDGGKKASAPEPIGRIVNTYDYIDATGQLLFQVVRFEPKTFRQRRPNGGGWQWGLGQTKPILYRLPDVLAAQTVLIPEGEKDVERLKALGFTATTSPMGAGKWRHEMGEALTGKHVVILPDNDEPGEKHALDIATSAADHDAKSVRVVRLPKLPAKGDVSDWLDSGNGREELEKAIRAAPLWRRSEEPGEGDPGWRSRLVTGDHGPLDNEANTVTALTWAPELAGRFRYDGFRTETQGRDMPWDARPEWRDLSDNDVTELAIWLQEQGINAKPIRVNAALEAYARRHEYHPVRQYLRGLKWDGVPRIERWTVTHLGAADLAYNRAVGRCWLIGAVARVMQPGCKLDTALILEGAQGMGKSTVMCVLAGQPWFADEISHLGSKDAAQDTRGKWIIELAELSAMTRQEVETVKAFMSRAVDHYRPSYGRRSIDVPRQCAFVGSTNRDDYLQDDTGNRRFWPVKVGVIDLAAVKRDRDQLWAEAVALYDRGVAWWLAKEEEDLAEVEQLERVTVDPWEGLVASHVALLRFVVIDDLFLMLQIPKERWSVKDQKRLAAILRRLGFVRGKEQGTRATSRRNGYVRRS